MVVHYYGDTYSTQCQFVNYIFNQTTCCANPASSACNKPCNATEINKVYAHWGINREFCANAISFDALKAQISLGIPNQAGWRWTGGGGHVILVVGYNHDPTNQKVVINDPGKGRGFITYQQLQNGQGYGSWIATWTNLTSLNHMITIQSLAENDYDALSKEIAQTDFSFLHQDAGNMDMDLADSFEVWFVRTDKIINLAIPDKQLFENTSQFHIHIFQKDEPRFFARLIKNTSKESGWELIQFFESVLAKKIEMKLQYLSKKRHESDYNLRLVEIPGLLITAFWISNEEDDRIIPVHYPENYNLQEEYSLADFRKLAIEKIPIVGIKEL
jgi:hypothetical protein